MGGSSDAGRSSAGEGLTRREVLQQALIGSGLALGLSACAGSSRPLGTDAARGLARRAPVSGLPGRRLPFVFDVVFDNPGQAPTETSFKNPRKLAAWGYDGQVVADWKPPTTAITYDRVAGDILPRGSSARAWVLRNAQQIERQTEAIHAAGLKALYHTDMIVFPTRLVERYAGDILDSSGAISLQKPMTRELLRVALAEIFARFPALDGLVIRTGEIYLQDLPYHTGSDPIVEGPASHLSLLEILREEACVKRGKLILYRTWGFDGFTDQPRVLPERRRSHPTASAARLLDRTHGQRVWRTVPQPHARARAPPADRRSRVPARVRGQGRPPQLHSQWRHRRVRGAARGPAADRAGGPRRETDVRRSADLVAGRGWNGPYIADELWCGLNAYVVSRWAQNRGSGGRAVRRVRGRPGPGRTGAGPLSAPGPAVGRRCPARSLQHRAAFAEPGLDARRISRRLRFRPGGRLRHHQPHGQARRRARGEAERRVDVQQIVGLADELTFADPGTTAFARLSSRYGALLYAVIAHGWEVMLRG